MINRLQIGHSAEHTEDFKIQLDVHRDESVEVEFSHRHAFYAIYWIHERVGIHMIDFVDYEIRPDRVFFVRPDQVHLFANTGDMCYSAIQFSEDFMLNGEMEYTIPNIETFVDIAPDARHRLKTLFGMMLAEHDAGLPNATPIIQSEVNTILLELNRLAGSNEGMYDIPEILIKFKKMVEKGFVELRQVSDYAIELGVTANYLNVLSRKYFSESALHIIHLRMTLEIKRLLVRTNLDISQIAYKLGFDELSYFSRFFRRNTGMTPLKFRERMHEMYHH